LKEQEKKTQAQEKLTEAQVAIVASLTEQLQQERTAAKVVQRDLEEKLNQATEAKTKLRQLAVQQQSRLVEQQQTIIKLQQKLLELERRHRTELVHQVQRSGSSSGSVAEESAEKSHSKDELKREPSLVSSDVPEAELVLGHEKSAVSLVSSGVEAGRGPESEQEVVSHSDDDDELAAEKEAVAALTEANPLDPIEVLPAHTISDDLPHSPSDLNLSPPSNSSAAVGSTSSDKSDADLKEERIRTLYQMVDKLTEENVRLQQKMGQIKDELRETRSRSSSIEKTNI
jgi:hypothetical protein